ncbi:MAG TPA: hypothetical protein VMF30_07760, partial [Pirellulales bacterium]|nr:hypothetical protein [Pirellulales bacterium]
MTQIVGQRPARGITLGRIFFQAFQADRFQVARNPWVQLARPLGFGLEHRIAKLGRAVPLKRPAAHQHLIEHYAQGPLVAGRPDVFVHARMLLGAHVGRRPHHGVHAGLQQVAFLAPGKAEIDDHRLAVDVDHHVARLDVSMHDSLAVGIVQGQGELLNQRGRGCQVGIRLL